MEGCNKLIAKLWPVAVWTQFIILISAATYLSLTPDPGGTLKSFSDKMLHLACWFVLLLSLHVAVGKRILPWYFALALLLYSGVIEVLQGLMPPREMSAADLLANATGIGAALLLVHLLAPLYQRWLLIPLQRLRDLNK